ncbi:MAG: tripartite tricarboxylate transporter substrate binding protein [Pigmentiphaga sp.]|uniref:Bug family tripartite tricarboxylate transporter substrate binding protein n=1 Tax=Pigmentiphaga sp. TaxID=1977564 RepID=UPI0029A9D25C|nr:tripartite tricarboxylate transporter substrate binding protein [Pigmentiphaga sp.]MDX3907081.1 tripartite tricarboxylate transporter substrate binding protein [Pigmentiphaga sp.]
MSRSLRFFCLALAALLSPGLAHAQSYPNRPVKVVVTFTPGGAADVTARIFSEKLAELWKQAVVVENRPGAGGSIGAEAVLRSPADGYTLLLATNTHIINQVVYPNLSFNFTKDFAPLGLVTSSPMMLVTNPALPVKNMKEFTELLKANPGKYEIASCNVASPHHFGLEMYKHAMGIEALHVPYRGCTPAVADVLAGHVHAAAVSAPAAIAFTKNGRLNALGLFSSEPGDSAPGVPTIRQSGIPELKDFALDNYYGFMAPPATPAAVLKKIEADVRQVAMMPDVRKRLNEAGLDMLVMNSTDMMKLVRADYEKYAKVAKEAGIQAE